MANKAVLWYNIIVLGVSQDRLYSGLTAAMESSFLRQQGGGFFN